MAHSKPFCIGFNCALGPKEMRPFLARLSNIAECYVSAYPNAGLPNALKGYDLKPPAMYDFLHEFATAGLINLAGGCCGTTPPHIAQIAAAVKGIKPREPQPTYPNMRLSGLEALTFRDKQIFVNVGERCNIAGSRKFKKMIMDGEYEKALAVAHAQVEEGAQVIDINMDEVCIITSCLIFSSLLFFLFCSLWRVPSFRSITTPIHQPVVLPTTLCQ